MPILSPKVEQGIDIAKEPRKGSWTMLRVITILLILALIVLSASILFYGYSYYTTPLSKRYLSPQHQDLKPGGRIGHLLGVAGSGMLIGLLAYSLRKRVRFMRNWGRLKTWLHFHIFLGLAGPVLITLHSASSSAGSWPFPTGA